MSAARTLLFIFMVQALVATANRAVDDVRPNATVTASNFFAIPSVIDTTGSQINF